MIMPVQIRALVHVSQKRKIKMLDTYKATGTICKMAGLRKPSNRRNHAKTDD